MEREQEQNKHPIAAPPPAPANAAADNGEYKDWLTEQLGYRPTLDERLEIARRAAIETGRYNPFPIEPLTDEERAASAESYRRLAAKGFPKVRRKSEDLIREMRDASVGIYPSPEPKS